MSESDDFQRFHDNILIKNTDVIASRYRAITRRLNIVYYNSTSETEHSLYVGSYGRNTGIDGISDLDMVFRLPYEVFTRFDAYYTRKQTSLLQAIKEVIALQYPRTDLSGDGQVVVIKFSDGLKVEVLPVFNTSGAGDYLYPDTNGGGSWRYCYPKGEMAAFSRVNQQTNGNFLRVARMMRAWRRHYSVPMSGILLDTLVANFLEQSEYASKSYWYFDLLCRDCLAYFAKQNPYQQEWYNRGGGDTVKRKGDFESKARRAHTRAEQGVKHYASKEYTDAIYEWRQVFGDYFTYA